MEKVTDFEIELHGISSSSFFKGSRTRMDDRFYGAGHTQTEAIDDAVEGAAQLYDVNYIDKNLDLSEYDGEKTVRDRIDEDEAFETDPPYFRVSLHIEINHS